MNSSSYRTGCGKKVVPCLFLATLFFSFSLVAQEKTSLESIQTIASMQPDVEYEQIAEQAVLKSRALKLAQDSYWHTLVHYKHVFGKRYKSLVDDPLFFCAEKGKTNPQAELEATIRAFFAPPPKENERHAIVRFPGRYKWLCQKLGLSSKDFPYDGDIVYKELIERVNPENVYLIFPTGYLKNPASIFGHTFLLVESKNQTRLLANSINYGAVTSITSGPMYAILGLVGGFPGYYAFMPYYDKIKQYANMDMRDMWEYRLTFNEEEVDNMLRHLFDLSGIYSRYFFISENCSFNLLYLIEAARPETRATHQLGHVVEPIATVKLLKELDLVDKVEYRPSVYSKIEGQKTVLTHEQNKYIKEVCYGKKTVEEFPFANENVETQAKIWNLAADYLTALLNSKKITPEEYRPRYIAVLSARRKLGKFELENEIQLPPDPQDAHGSKKISVHGGHDIGGFYTGLSYRLTAHEQLENPAGYADNSQLVFGALDVRFYPTERKFYLKKALLADVTSLSTSDVYFFNTALQMVIGIDSNPNEDEEEDLAGRAKFMFGTSFRPIKMLHLYGLAGVDSFWAPCYDDNYYTDLLLGAEVGFITTAGIWKNKIAFNAFQSPFDKDHLRISASAEESLNISKNASLKGLYSFNKDYDYYWHEWTLSANIYF